MKFKRVLVCFPVCTSLRSKEKIQDFRNTGNSNRSNQGSPQTVFMQGIGKNFGGSMSWDC